MGPDSCHDIADLRAAARRRLPRGLFEYVDRGCDGDVGIARNRAAFEAITFAPRVLQGVAQRSTASTLFGQNLSMPAAIAPMSPAGLLWHEGEGKLAAAARAAGIPYTLPTESMTRLEAISATMAGSPWWFQLYVWVDKATSFRLVERVAEAGASVLLLTVDTAVAPHRAFNYRNGFATPFKPRPRNLTDMLLHPGWLIGTMGRYALTTGVPRMLNHPGSPGALQGSGPASKLNGGITWDDVAALRRVWPGKLLVKGILRADDARRAIEAGADGVVVSNHGARNLDGATASITALPAIAAEIGQHGSILLDSGIRHGADIARALALGADAVLLGRAVLFGLAAYGQAGAARALHLLRHEFETAMALLGAASPGEITRDMVRP
ncbi:MAG: L-lactate dehydrogenase [Pseudomonadota bacterium]|jgi:(S)-mandelate dehydrogenase|nr:alpha-hydroxy-acid oxidizing protein [Acetobacteraceae bacterium]NBS43630.1 alpha-hydroxy-acid oxidizing protein [Acetobacteraceae bacterium]